MAVALKTNQFNFAHEVAVFASTAGNNVTTIVAIVYDAASGKYVIFYT
jgi:hypothetical protein